ncbi:hypothetical protein ACIA8F_05015 [Streptomyces sp. NPDC051563]|uniref:hypothetical protein n=1 Tax=Streptomyces sp. NPDC051563 TaxID=3365659 RepID=UPI0037A31022
MSTRPTAFEGRLKAELVAIAADRAQSGGGAELVARSPARRLRIPLAVGLAAVVAAGLIALPVMGDQGGSSAAYALSRSDDGSIVVNLYNPDGIAGVERELRALGIPVAVVPEKPQAQCPAVAGGFDGPVGLITDERGVITGVSQEQLFGFRKGGDGGLVLTINARTLPAGHTLVLVDPVRPRLTYVGAGSMPTERVPSCLPDFSVADAPTLSLDVPGKGAEGGVSK